MNIPACTSGSQCAQSAQPNGLSARLSGGSSGQRRARPSCVRSTRTAADCPAAWGVAHTQRNALGVAAVAVAPWRFSSRHCQVAAAAAAGGSYSGASPSRYDAPGPYQPVTLPVMTQQLGVSPTGGTLEVQLEVITPQGLSGCPVALVTPGFLLNSALYRSTASRLASWGWAVVLWDLNEVLDDTLTLVYMKQVVEVLLRRCGSQVDPGRLLLVGHSRGAKLSALMAAQEAAVCGLVLLDPVDRSDMGPSGVGYPTALPGLTAATRSRYLPTLVVGAGANSGIVPADANWHHFTAAAAAGGSSPVWEVVVREAGHLQFVDKQVGLMQLFAASGPLSDEAVRRVSQWAMVAWVAAAVAPGRGASHGAGRAGLLEGVGTALGRLAAVNSKFSHLQLLQQAAGPSQQQQQQQTAAAGNGRGRSSAGWESYSGSGAGSSGWERRTPAAGQAAPVGSYEQLMALRVKELKSMLADRGVDSSDCFEKSDLVRKLLAIASA